MTFYKTTAEKPLEKDFIGLIPLENNAYFHSIGYGPDYAVFIEQPMTYNLINMALSKPMLEVL